MPTIQQLVRSKRTAQKKKTKSPVMQEILRKLRDDFESENWKNRQHE